MRKVLCTLITVCLLLTMLPVAFAEGVSGTFEGESTGFHGPVKVSVTLDNGAITDVTVTEQAETYGVSDWSLSEMPNRIVEHQSWNVDATTGATFSANAVKYAVKNALEAAGAEGLDAEVHETAEDETLDTDVLVIGAGIAGLTAAIEAANAGAKVVVLEKLDRLGGSSVTSGGYVYGTGSQMNKDEDIDGYHPEDIVAYYMERTGGDMDEEMVTFWAEHSGESVDWLIDDMGVVFDAGVVASGTSPALRAHLTSAGGGPIMVPIWEKALANENITVVRHAPVLELIADGDVVTGALADHYGANLTVNAKAVVVACGGFDRSEEYMAKYVPNSEGVPSMSSCGNTGDEIAWAEALDAALMFKGGVMGMHTTDASYTLTGTINLLSFLPTLGVNDKGERFMNESLDYPLFYEAMDKNGTSCAWWIFDTSMSDFVPLMDLAVSRRYGVTADTLEALGEAAGLDADTFAATVARYNELGAKGEDEDFGRAGIYPLSDEGPYYAIKVIRSTVAGFGGFMINTDAQVLKNDATAVFPNLFAAGECASGQFFATVYPCSGSMLSISTTFGRVAGQNAAAVALAE
ncbi:MAG: FAD-dependent oxidoreductase [Clostridia bacterium]|nr:FAD-dependent oxidoreductase [Clostridia bacterium]